MGSCFRRDDNETFKGNLMSIPVTDSVDSAGPLLFQPFKIRGLTLKNRLVVPPMVHYRAGPGSTCGMFHNVHLGRYALHSRCRGHAR